MDSIEPGWNKLNDRHPSAQLLIPRDSPLDNKTPSTPAPLFTTNSQRISVEAPGGSRYLTTDLGRERMSRRMMHGTTIHRMAKRGFT